MDTRSCWCGARSFREFSPDYLECASCGTLVSRQGLRHDEIAVTNDEESFYGKNYWLAGMEQDGKELKV